MVFAAVASNGLVMDPIIFPPGTTVNSESYRELVLLKVMRFIMERFATGAPAHTSKATQS